MPKGTKFFGDGLPYLKLGDLKGKLIAIEGTDGVGRSTQIELLEEWLQVQGYGVLVTGWTRSNLMSKSIEMAKNGNMLNRMTFSLLYATDFADRLENQILPALRSGFVVLADRYIYTAFARDSIRNPDMSWVKDAFGFALVPDLVCYLRIDVDNLIPRVIESGGMNYWESGMDLHLADNMYDSFKKYQRQLIQSYDDMAEKYRFEVLDARQPVEEIQNDLRARIQKILPPKKGMISLPPIRSKAANSDKPIHFQEIQNKLHAFETNLSSSNANSLEETKPEALLTAPHPLPIKDDKVLPFLNEETDAFRVKPGSTNLN